MSSGRVSTTLKARLAGRVGPDSDFREWVQGTSLMRRALTSALPAGASAGPLFVSSVKRVLNKITVRTLASGTKLGYATPLGGKPTLRFRPAAGC
jgi:hypothetical protein